MGLIYENPLELIPPGWIGIENADRFPFSGDIWERTIDKLSSDTPYKFYIVSLLFVGDKTFGDLGIETLSADADDGSKLTFYVKFYAPDDEHFRVLRLDDTGSLMSDALPGLPVLRGA
tara:strand:- start:220 stop:573 length:354 start_codon:yes stop_codon:yes gene_type:complete